MRDSVEMLGFHRKRPGKMRPVVAVKKGFVPDLFAGLQKSRVFRFDDVSGIVFFVCSGVEDLFVDHDAQLGWETKERAFLLRPVNRMLVWLSQTINTWSWRPSSSAGVDLIIHKRDLVISAVCTCVESSLKTRHDG